MKPKQQPRKQKIPAEFTRYLLEGIRKIREAATTTPAEPEHTKGPHHEKNSHVTETRN